MLDRRSAIITLAAAIASGCASQVSVSELSTRLTLEIDLEDDFDTDQKLAHVTDKLGREYGRLLPAEADPMTLCQFLFGTDSPPPSTTIHERMKKKVREDFRNDDLVLLSGWYITRSEGRLCLLASEYGLV